MLRDDFSIKSELLCRQLDVNPKDIYLPKSRTNLHHRGKLASNNIVTSYGICAHTCEFAFLNLTQVQLEPQPLVLTYANIDFKDLSNGSAIFTVAERIEDLCYFLSRIQNNKKFVVVIGRSDISITNEIILKLLNTNHVYHIFAQNCIANFGNHLNRKVSQLPLGIENKDFIFPGNPWNSPGIINSIISSLRVKQPRSREILGAFGLTSNRNVRKNALLKLLQCDYLNLTNTAGTCSAHDQKSFYNSLSNSELSACPVGNGIDTHRFWLSILFGCMPVITNNSIYREFSFLPYLLLNDWDDLKELSMNELIEIANKSSYDWITYLSLDYWVHKINHKKQNILLKRFSVEDF